jgi:hypothetical protein
MERKREQLTAIVGLIGCDEGPGWSYSMGSQQARRSSCSMIIRQFRRRHWQEMKRRPSCSARTPGSAFLGRTNFQPTKVSFLLIVRVDTGFDCTLVVRTLRCFPTRRRFSDILFGRLRSLDHFFRLLLILRKSLSQVLRIDFVNIRERLTGHQLLEKSRYLL